MTENSYDTAACGVKYYSQKTTRWAAKPQRGEAD